MSLVKISILKCLFFPLASIPAAKAIMKTRCRIKRSIHSNEIAKERKKIPVNPRNKIRVIEKRSTIVIIFSRKKSEFIGYNLNNK